MIQTIIAYTIVFIMFVYWIKRIFFKKKKGEDSCGGGSCGCG
ncbi:MAG: FeoB-associated Cys-rich membrane protein [Flavobacteriaceae bacterium]|nr:FeoB-associated Cys-rich membrane protein [Flavobacteriaceae bacterium]